MSSSSTKLDLIKKVCSKIVEDEENLAKHIAELKSLISRGLYFEYHSVSQLLELLQNNKKLGEATRGKIFEVVENVLLLQNGSGREDIANKLYAFCVSCSTRPDIYPFLLTISQKLENVVTAKPEMLGYISEQLFKGATTSSHKRILFNNLRALLEKSGSDQDTSIKLFSIFLRLVSKLCADSKWQEYVDLLEATLIPALRSGNCKVTSKDLFKDYLKIILYTLRLAHSETKVILALQNLLEHLKQASSDPELIKSSQMIAAALKIFSAKTITATLLKEFQAQFLTSPKFCKSFCFQKSASTVSKLLILKFEKFEASSECLLAFHQIIVGLMHIFKNIKDESGWYNCCNDIKRHETFAINASMIPLCQRFASEGVFPASCVKIFNYHLKYGLQLCGEIKCEQIRVVNIFVQLVNVIWEIQNRKELVPDIIHYLDETVSMMFKSHQKLAEEEKKKTLNPLNLAWKIYEEPKDKRDAAFSANGIASLIRYRKSLGSEEFSGMTERRLLIKLIGSLRNAVKLLRFQSAFDFMTSKDFKDRGFAGDHPDLGKAELLSLEISAISRYGDTSDIDMIGKLFEKLCAETSDPFILAESCQHLTDDIVKTLDSSLFDRVNETIERETKKGFHLDLSLGLAFSNYSLYYAKDEEITDYIKASDSKYILRLNLQKELDLYKYLNASLQHFTDVVLHLTSNKTDYDKIFSKQRMLSVLNNIAYQYHVRAIKTKELEAFTILWRFNEIQIQSAANFINVATFFLDHHEVLKDSIGNYIKLSKKMKVLTIEEVITKITALMKDELVEKFKDQPEPTQYLILSYLLSLWVFQTTQGEKSTASHHYHDFKKLFDSLNPPEKSTYRQVIESKIYFSLAEINLTCHGRSADNFRSLAAGSLNNIEKLDPKFSFQFYQIFYHVNLKAINCSYNRHTDMDHFEHSMLRMIQDSTKRGYCLKTMELLSLSILRYLNMEKLDNAKNQLKEITRLLGLKEEILIETPKKIEVSVGAFDFESTGIAIRKAAVHSPTPISCEISMIHQDHSTEMIRQLKTFVHDNSCPCQICQFPQLKFIMFQIGCHYSRLLWLLSKPDISMDFNKFALEAWQNVSDQLRRVRKSDFLMINKTDFSVFSLRWLLQCADTFTTMGNFDDVEEIFSEIELILSPNIPDYKCLREKIFCRKENLSFMMERGLPQEQEKESLSFADFMKSKHGNWNPKVPVLVSFKSRKSPLLDVVSNPSKEQQKIYVDEEENKSSEKPRKIVKKKEIATPTSSGTVVVKSMSVGSLVKSSSGSLRKPSSSATSVKVTSNSSKTSSSAKSSTTNPIPASSATTASTKKPEVVDLTSPPARTRATTRRRML